MRTTLIPLFFNLRTLGLLLGYWVILFVSYWVAFELRFDFAVTDYYRVVRLDTLWWVLTLKLALLFAFGQFETVLAYFRLPDAIRLFLALLVAAIVFVFSWYQLGGEAITPRSVILSDLQLSFLALASFRLFFRLKASKSLSDWLTLQGVERVLVIGAGEVGAGLASELLSKGRLGMRPVAFLDDDPKKVGRFVHGVPVAGDVDDLPRVAKECSAKKVIIAFPSAAIKRVKAVASIAQDAGLIVETVPALTDLVSGKATVSQVRPVNLEDLLGRESVDLNDSAIESLIAEKRILITGAGGSIGSELVEQVLQRGPAEVLCLDQSELAIFNLQQKLGGRVNSGTEIKTLVLDICDESSLRHIMEDLKPQVVFTLRRISMLI
jgi:FlaA1/EpsC-like NDP-sugar epimerase